MQNGAELSDKNRVELKNGAEQDDKYSYLVLPGNVQSHWWNILKPF